MRRYIISGIAILFAAFIVGGCVTYDQDLYIAKDGSGVVKVYYSMINFDTGEGMGTDVDVVPPSFSTDEREIREMYSGDGIDLKDVKIKSDESLDEVYLLIEFDNVLDLNGHGVWDENQVIGTRIEDGNLLFIQDISNPDARTLTAEEKQLYDSYVFGYVLHLPNEIIETNGLRGKDNKSVYWEYPLSVVESNSHLQMHASCEAPPEYRSSRTGGAAGLISGVSLFAVIGCCAFLFLVVIIIIVVVLVKRKKKPIIPQATTPKPKTETVTKKPEPEKAKTEESVITKKPVEPIVTEPPEPEPTPETKAEAETEKQEEERHTGDETAEETEKKPVSDDKRWEESDSFD